MKQECYVSENFRFKFQVIMGAVRGFLQNISCKTSKKIVVQMLAWFNQSFTRILIETAMGRKISKDEEILLDDGKWIKMRNVFKYPFFQRAIEKVKSSPSSLSYFLAHISIVNTAKPPISDHPKCDDLVVA